MVPCVQEYVAMVINPEEWFYVDKQITHRHNINFIGVLNNIGTK